MVGGIVTVSEFVRAHAPYWGYWTLWTGAVLAYVTLWTLVVMVFVHYEVGRLVRGPRA